MRNFFLEYNEDLTEFIGNGLKSETKHLMSALVSKERQFATEVDDQMAIDDAKYLCNVSSLCEIGFINLK